MSVMESVTEDVVNGIQELLFYLDPLVRSCGGRGEVEGLVSYLQEMDDGWESYSFVTWIKTEIRLAMLDIIQEEIGKGEDLTPHTMQVLAPSVLAKLVKNPRWSSLVEKVKETVSVASCRVKSTINDEIAAAQGLSTAAPPTNHMHQPESLESMYQTNFIFVQPDQVGQLAKQLAQEQTDEARIEALNTLQLTQLADLLGGENWMSLRTGLSLALSDTNHVISNLGLKIHARLVISGSHFAIKEGFINLVQTVSDWYRDKSMSKLLPTTEFCSNKYMHINTVNLIHLLLTISEDLPQFWIRYPQKYIHEIMESMIRLLSEDCVCQVIAMVSPCGSWFSHWMHATLSRSILITVLSEYQGYATNLVQQIIESLETTDFATWKLMGSSVAALDTEDVVMGGSNVMQYSMFLQNIHILTCLVKYRQTNQLLPHRQTLALTMANFMCRSDSEEVSRGPGAVLSTCLGYMLRHKEHYYQSVLDTLLDCLSTYCEGSSIIPNQTIKNILETLNLAGLDLQPCNSALGSLCILVLSQRPPGPLLEPVLECFLLNMIDILDPQTQNILTCICKLYCFLAGQIVNSTPTNSKQGERITHLHKRVAKFMKEIGSRPGGIWLIQENVTSPGWLSSKDAAALLCVYSPQLSSQLQHEQFPQHHFEVLWKILAADDEFAESWPSDLSTDILAEAYLQKLMLFFSSVTLVQRETKPSDAEDKSLMHLFRFKESIMENNLPSFSSCLTRLVTIMCKNLDCALYLEAEHSLTHLLMDLQADVEEQGIDLDFVYRRYTLADISHIGGHAEKELPTISLEEEQESHVWKVSLWPSQGNKQLDQFLDKSGTNVSDIGWKVEAIKKIRSTLVSTNLSLTQTQVRRLLLQFVAAGKQSSICRRGRFTSDDDDVVVGHIDKIQICNKEDIEQNSNLHQDLGIKLILDYGQQIGCLAPLDQHDINLRYLYDQCKSLFKEQIGDCVKFPWMVSSLYLLTGGDVPLVESLLEYVPCVLVSPHPLLLLASVGECVDYIASREIPALTALLHQDGLCPSIMTGGWVSQCWLNVLEWREIVHYLVLLLLLGTDYAVYFTLAVLSHQEKWLLEADTKCSATNLYEAVLTTNIKGFHTGDYLPFMEKLCKRYQPNVLKYLSTFHK